METNEKSWINQQKCTQCRLCIEVCPCNIIGIDNNDKVAYIPDKQRACIRCGQCMAICRSTACHIADMSYQDFHDLPQPGVSGENFIEFISTRRSIRNFKNRPVSSEVLDQVLDAVSYAPFASAPDKMHITVINNRKRIEESLQHISNFLDNIIKWMENPVASFMIKRRKGIEQFNTIRNHLYPIAKTGNYRLENGDRISRGAPAIMVFHAEKSAEGHTDNSLIYATYAMLAAHAVGLGGCMIGIIPAAINKLPEVKELYGIPESHEAAISLILGYPKYKYKRTIKRQDHKIHYVN